MILRYASTTGSADNSGVDKSDPWDLRTLLAWLNKYSSDAGAMWQVLASGAVAGEHMTLTIPSIADSIDIYAEDSISYIQTKIDSKKLSYPEWDSVFVAGDTLLNDGPLYIVSKHEPIQLGNTDINSYGAYMPGTPSSIAGAVQAGTYDISVDQELHLFGGSIAENKPAMLIGFKDNIGFVDGYPVSDLDRDGGAMLGVTGYYVRPDERMRRIKASGYTAMSEYPRINGQGYGFTDGLLDTRFSELIAIRNMHFDNVDGVLIKANTDVQDDPAYEYQECRTLSLIECTFTRCTNAVSWHGDHLLLEGAVVEGASAPALAMKKNASFAYIRNACIDASGVNLSDFKIDSTIVVSDTIIVGGDRLVQGTSGSRRIFDNCTLIDQTECISQCYDDSYTTVRNCIIRLDDLATAGFLDNGTNGYIDESSNIYHSNMYHATKNPGGVIPLTDFINPGSSEIVMHATSKIVDVAFKDEANWDFTPLNKEAVWPRQLGAVRQQYQSVTRARGTNYGRVGILR